MSSRHKQEVDLAKLWTLDEYGYKDINEEVVGNLEKLQLKIKLLMSQTDLRLEQKQFQFFGHSIDNYMISKLLWILGAALFIFLDRTLYSRNRIKD
jgi:hypothetical protein